MMILLWTVWIICGVGDAICRYCPGWICGFCWMICTGCDCCCCCGWTIILAVRWRDVWGTVIIDGDAAVVVDSGLKTGIWLMIVGWIAVVGELSRQTTCCCCCCCWTNWRLGSVQ